MKDYIDHVAYPITLAVTYILLGFVNWDSNPGEWPMEHRILWVVWGLGWGFALRLRIRGKHGL
jgi:hypothetical protein